MRCLSNFAEFYPKINIVEAYLRSKNRHGAKNNIQILRLWSKIMESIRNQQDSLGLSSGEIAHIYAGDRKIDAQRDEVGLNYSEPIKVELPGKVDSIIPEIIAKLERRIILIFNSNGCNIATGFGSQKYNRKITPVYQSTNTDKTYQFFGMEFFTKTIKVPARVVNEITYGNTGKITVRVKAWEKEKLVEFLEDFDSTIPVEEKVNNFLRKLENEKEYEIAAEWLKKLPRATKRSLYDLKGKDLLTRRAYRGKRNRGLIKCEILRDFKNRVYISQNRERCQIETDLIVCEYDRIPMAECEGDGLFREAGPLLAAQLSKELTELVNESYIPRSIVCNGYRLPTEEVMFITRTPELQSMEDLEMGYDEIINHTINTGIRSINLPVLGAEIKQKRGYRIEKLVKLFKRKIGKLVSDTTMKVIISLGKTPNQREIIQRLRNEKWNLDTSKNKARKDKPAKRVNLAEDNLVKFTARLNGKVAIALVDSGSEINLIDKRWLKFLKKGKDYEYIKDSMVHEYKDNGILYEGTIRIKPHAGLQLNQKVKRIGMEACVIVTRKDKSWDLLIGNKLPLQLGNVTIQLKEKEKPLVKIEPTKESEVKLKTLEGEDAKEVVLDTLPRTYERIYTSNSTVVEPLEGKVHADITKPI